MLNFTVGPVLCEESICTIGAEQIPYFRTPEFSAIMLENERLMKEFAGADKNGRVIFLTGSGTAAMEAAVMNAFTEQDTVLIVNGGGFGQRFVEICKIHKIPYREIVLSAGQALTQEHLRQWDTADLTGFLVNIHETSTGVLYDMDMIGEFCRKHGLFLIADGISSFLADPLDMQSAGIDMFLTGSQKALACPPGVSVIVLSERGVQRIEEHAVRSLYFDLKDALKNGARGQTPFTPAVSILLQIHARLHSIQRAGGVESETKKIQGLAQNFRENIQALPFTIPSASLSNAMTPLHPLNVPAYEVFTTLKEDYQIWVCPNGGALRDEIFRVGHLGALTQADNDTLILALQDMQQRGLL